MKCEKCKNEINPSNDFYNVEKDQCFVDDWRKEDEEHGTYYEDEPDFGATLSMKKICDNCIPDQIKKDFKDDNDSCEVYCKICDKLIKNKQIYYTIDKIRNFEVIESIYYCENHLPK